MLYGPFILNKHFTKLVIEEMFSIVSAAYVTAVNDYWWRIRNLEGHPIL